MLYPLADTVQNSFHPGLLAIIGLLAIWDLAWKGMGLWRAARNGDNAWFVVMLIINSVGILPILYLYVFSKPEGKATK